MNEDWNKDNKWIYNEIQSDCGSAAGNIFSALSNQVKEF